MREEIEDWLVGLYLNWSHLCEFVKCARGVVTDREGKRYWQYIYEYSPGHFRLSLYPWPGLTYSGRRSAGWISVGTKKGETIWMIYDVRVEKPRNRQRGIGTALVQAAIAHARAHRGTYLWGWIMYDDAQTHPFLPHWYAQLGFTVQEVTGGDAIARFWMDLTTSRSPHLL